MAGLGWVSPSLPVFLLGVELGPWRILDARHLLTLLLLLLVPDAQADGEQQQHHPGPDQHIGHRECLALKNAAACLCLVPLSCWLLRGVEAGHQVPHGHDDPKDQHSQADGSQCIV